MNALTERETSALKPPDRILLNALCGIKGALGARPITKSPYTLAAHKKRRAGVRRRGRRTSFRGHEPHRFRGSVAALQAAVSGFGTFAGVPSSANEPDIIPFGNPNHLFGKSKPYRFDGWMTTATTDPGVGFQILPKDPSEDSKGTGITMPLGFNPGDIGRTYHDLQVAMNLPMLIRCATDITAIIKEINNSCTPVFLSFDGGKPSDTELKPGVCENPALTYALGKAVVVWLTLSAAAQWKVLAKSAMDTLLGMQEDGDHRLTAYRNVYTDNDLEDFHITGTRANIGIIRGFQKFLRRNRGDTTPAGDTTMQEMSYVFNYQLRKAFAMTYLASVFLKIMNVFLPDHGTIIAPQLFETEWVTCPPPGGPRSMLQYQRDQDGNKVIRENLLIKNLSPLRLQSLTLAGLKDASNLSDAPYNSSSMSHTRDAEFCDKITDPEWGYTLSLPITDDSCQWSTTQEDGRFEPVTAKQVENHHPLPSKLYGPTCFKKMEPVDYEFGVHRFVSASYIPGTCSPAAASA